MPHHPYAGRATENICRACEQVKIEYLRLSRESSAASADGIFMCDIDACVGFLKNTEGAIFLTTGSKELPAFCADEMLRRRIYARVLPIPDALEVCAHCGLTPERIFAMQGPFDEEMNLAMLHAARARFLVTKDTGDAGGYAAKIRAAERAGVQPIVIGRPPQADGMSLNEAVRELEERFSLAGYFPNTLSSWAEAWETQVAARRRRMCAAGSRVPDWFASHAGLCGRQWEDHV